MRFTPAGVPGTDSSTGMRFDSDTWPDVWRNTCRKPSRCAASAFPAIRLLPARMATRLHNHGRRATNAAKLAVLNWPRGPMKRDISGISKPNSSEMAFMVLNLIP